MPRLTPRVARWSLIGVVGLAGCAAVRTSPSSRHESGSARFARVLDSLRMAESLEADEVPSAPRIRLVVPPASFVVNDRYVEASFRVSSDAYVLVVAVDRDRRIRVLHPEAPDESGFASADTSYRLTRFFAGFGAIRSGAYDAYHSRYDASQRISPFSGRGVLLAVASDRPLQLDRLLGPDGEWNEHALGQLVFEQTLAGAAHSIGRLLVLSGQDYNTDHTTFSGGRSFNAFSSYASNGIGCRFASAFDRYDASYDGSASAYGPLPLTRFVGFYQRDGRTYARYAQGGGCGSASYYDVPVTPATTATPRTPVTPDTSVKEPVPVRRVPRFPGAPRFPSVSGDSGGRVQTGVSVPRERDRDRERPVVAAGLRFRPPEQVPGEDTQPIARRMSPRQVTVPAGERPHASDEPSIRRQGAGDSERASVRQEERREAVERRAEPRAESVRERPAREAPVREAPAPVERARGEPAPRQTEPREPVQREAPQRERVQREPPTPSPTPTPP